MTARGSITIEGLRGFVEVADTGSINGAAQRLGIAQSNLSRKMRLLEQCIGAELLIRRVDGCHLTGTGASVLEVARQVLALTHELHAKEPPVEGVSRREHRKPGGDDCDKKRGACLERHRSARGLVRTSTDQGPRACVDLRLT